MTSISSVQSFSPLAMMDARISAATSAGSISTEDQNALKKALDSIDASITSERSSGARPTGDVKAKIDSLIEQQVKSGTLTEDQAKELKDFFAEGPGAMNGASGAQGMGAMGGMGGMPPPPPPGMESSDSSDSEDSSDTDITAEMNKQIEALMTFLKELQSSLSNGLYGENSSSSSAGNTGLVVDTLA